MRRTSILRVASVAVCGALSACTGTFGGGEPPTDAALDVTPLDARLAMWDAPGAALDAPSALDAPLPDGGLDAPEGVDAYVTSAEDVGLDAPVPVRCGGSPCRSEFVFRQQTNGMPLPSEPTGNGYVKVTFPSHSRIATPIGSTMPSAQSASAWWLYAADGTLVASIEDDLGGFHPNFFDAPEVNDSANPDYARFRFVREWIAAFVPFGPFPDARSRGNNHFPEYERYVLEGSYTWRYHNRASIPVRLECGLIRASGGHGDVDRVIAPGETVELTLVIRANPADAFDSYKMNTNGY
jgi:hypothetical protein